MLQDLAAQLTAMARRTLDEGRSAIVWGAVIAVAGGTGLGLLLLALHMALARAIGQIAATALMGLALVTVAALIALWRQRRTSHRPRSVGLASPQGGAPLAPTLPILAFVASFVAARTLSRLWSRRQS